jgi:hypothetical protein
MQMNLKIRLHCFIQSIVVVLLMTLRLVPIGGQSISSEWVELGKLVPKVLVFDGQVFNGRCDSGY